MNKILEMGGEKGEKDEQEIMDDIFFEKLVTHEDSSYFVYLDILRPIIDEDYNDYTLDQLHIVDKELKEAKAKSGKKNRKRKRPGKKGEVKEEKEKE